MNSADALLVILARAEQSVRPKRPHFLFVKAGAWAPMVIHIGLPDGEAACEEADILDLEQAGYLRVNPSGGPGTVFDITDKGRDRAAKLDVSNRASAGGLVNDHALNWDRRVLPVLQAVGRAYSHAPSPMGVRTEDIVDELGPDADAYGTALALDELVRAQYLEQTASTDQLPGSAWSRLTEKGLQVTAGWPSSSGEVALDRLLMAINDQIAASVSEEERSKWERLRDGVADVGRDVFVDVLTTTVNAAAKSLT